MLNATYDIHTDQKKGLVKDLRWLFCAWVFAQNIAFAQVVNDNILNRSILMLDSSAIRSSTDEATVQWQCINKALTNKCLIYHNDQWFSFSVMKEGKYYLIVSSQRCRDAKGVQAIVIEGNPCEVATYKILRCIPQISQEDVYIELEGVKPDVSYLVNIDGFLGDFCNFDIQLSSKPAGLRAQADNLDTLMLTSVIQKNVVTLRWTLPRAFNDNIETFEIRRRAKGEARYHRVGIVPAEFNTLGDARSDYLFFDTLSSRNTYSYEVLGLLNNGTKEIMDRHSVTFRNENTMFSQTLEVGLDFKEGTDVRIILINKNTNKILRQSAFQFRRTQDHVQNIYVGDYIEMGVRNFIVRIVSGKTFNVKDYEFVVTEDGSITKL